MLDALLVESKWGGETSWIDKMSLVSVTFSVLLALFLSVMLEPDIGEDLESTGVFSTCFK
jgi:hypothetical protein